MRSAAKPPGSSSGTVVSTPRETVTVGGGDLPVVTYRLRVQDSFKGTVEEVKGMRFTGDRSTRPS